MRLDGARSVREIGRPGWTRDQAPSGQRERELRLPLEPRPRELDVARALVVVRVVRVLRLAVVEADRFVCGATPRFAAGAALPRARDVVPLLRDEFVLPAAFAARVAAAFFPAATRAGFFARVAAR